MIQNYPMRLHNREINDPEIINNVLNSCHVVNIAFPSKEYPYIVPMLYGYDYVKSTNKLTLYIHGAKEGRKNDLIKDGKTQVGIEIDDKGTFLPTVTGIADHNTRLYKSIIGYGDIVPVTDFQEKKKAQELLLVHETGHEWEISKHSIEFVTIYKINIIHFTGKQHLFSDYNGRTLNVPSEY